VLINFSNPWEPPEVILILQNYPKFWNQMFFDSEIFQKTKNQAVAELLPLQEFKVSWLQKFYIGSITFQWLALWNNKFEFSNKGGKSELIRPDIKEPHRMDDVLVGNLL
jgi:hypothetical protein